MWPFARALRKAAGTGTVVASLPPALEGMIRDAVPGLVSTWDAVENLFQSARRSVKILCPYVDPTVTALIRSCRAEVAIVTTAREGRRTEPNPVLERLADSGRVLVRYLVRRRRGTHLFQVHAKMILCDRAVAYVGSANLTDTSLRYNLELGLVTRDPAEIAALDALFEFVFGTIAEPAAML